MPYSTALITGASSGLGRGLALWFAQRGTKVYAAARREAQLESLQKEAPDGLIVPVKMDVGDADATHDAIAKLDAKVAFDLVIANAGVGGDTYAKRIDWKKVSQILQVNVVGAAATLSAALPGMVERKKGHLVGVSSLAAFRGLPRSAAYCGSKSFLATFMESLRVDLQSTPLKVTCLHPGFVKTEMTSDLKFSMPFLLELDDAVKQMGEAIEEGVESFLFPWQMAMAVKTLHALPNGLYGSAARFLK